MSPRRSFLDSVLKASAASMAHYERERLRAERERVRHLNNTERETKKLEREVRLEYLQQRQEEAESLTAELDRRIEEFTTILSRGLTSARPIDFHSLKRQPETRPFQGGALATAERPPARREAAPPSLLRRLFPGAKRRHAEATDAARQRYELDIKRHAEREAVRERALSDARSKHEAEMDRLKQEADAWNAQIDRFVAEYGSGEPVAIRDYCRLVLDSNDGPEGFSARVAFVPESKQLVVECECPTFDAVPEEAGYKYVKTKDEIVATLRPVYQRRSLYSPIIAQLMLRTIHQLFTADTRGHIESIVANGHVTAIDKGTGRVVHPCIVTIRTTRDVFTELNLRQVEPMSCLKGLSASVSPSPAELVPVRPVLEFNMVDPRFIEETEVLATLDQRPNLMALSPSEFESLISNLFEKMGLETRVTQASRDGGVDCVAYDPRPIFGGKVIIQAKRYKNTVGVSAVRDLFGTLQNEGASKGILVTTSGYGKAAFEFAEGKPLELLGGSHLLYLLEQHAGLKAKIEVPDAWMDPIPDSPGTA